MPAYIKHIISYINPRKLSKLKLVVNAGNSSAGSVVDAIEQELQTQGINIEFIKIHHRPDGTFPNGIPNPYNT